MKTLIIKVVKRKEANVQNCILSSMCTYMPNLIDYYLEKDCDLKFAGCRKC